MTDDQSSFPVIHKVDNVVVRALRLIPESDMNVTKAIPKVKAVERSH